MCVCEDKQQKLFTQHFIKTQVWLTNNLFPACLHFICKLGTDTHICNNYCTAEPTGFFLSNSHCTVDLVLTAYDK